jgi:hypothetical protein
MSSSMDNNGRRLTLQVSKDPFKGRTMPMCQAGAGEAPRADSLASYSFTYIHIGAYQYMYINIRDFTDSRGRTSDRQNGKSGN